jgi:hypothetical protein
MTEIRNGERKERIEAKKTLGIRDSEKVKQLERFAFFDGGFVEHCWLIVFWSKSTIHELEMISA